MNVEWWRVSFRILSKECFFFFFYFILISRHNWESLLEGDCESLIFAVHRTNFTMTSVLAICKGMSLQYTRIHLETLLRLCGQVSIVSIKEHCPSDWGGESQKLLCFFYLSITHGKWKGSIYQGIITSKGGKEDWKKARAYMWHDIIHFQNNVLWDWQYSMKYSSHNIVMDTNNVMESVSNTCVCLYVQIVTYLGFVKTRKDFDVSLWPRKYY